MLPIKVVSLMVGRFWACKRFPSSPSNSKRVTLSFGGFLGKYREAVQSFGGTLPSLLAVAGSRTFNFAGRPIQRRGAATDREPPDRIALLKRTCAGSDVAGDQEIAIGVAPSGAAGTQAQAAEFLRAIRKPPVGRLRAKRHGHVRGG